MYKLAGNFKTIIPSLIGIFFSLVVSAAPSAQGPIGQVNASAIEGNVAWEEFAKETTAQEREDFRRGISYIISGGLALAGGLVGAQVATDPAEKGIYSVFQTIGIASIGYGAYTWQIGSEERTLYRTLMGSGLSAEGKTKFLEAYRLQESLREKRERVIKAITHGLIAGLNFYNASQQSQEGVQTALYFIGSVNALAALSYTFEF